MSRACDQCEALSINGVACHEHGCPDSWIDLATGLAYPIPCFECGFDFTPEDENYSTACPSCSELIDDDELPWEDGASDHDEPWDDSIVSYR